MRTSSKAIFTKGMLFSYRFYARLTNVRIKMGTKKGVAVNYSPEQTA